MTGGSRKPASLDELEHVFLRYLSASGGRTPDALRRDLSQSPEEFAPLLRALELMAWPHVLAARWDVTPSARETFLSWFREANARTARISVACEAVARALNDAGIWHRLLKGAVTSTRLYPVPALRARADIDVLVPPATPAEVLRKAMAQIGAHPRTPRRSRNNFEWTFAGPVCDIDVHVALVPIWRIPWLGHRELIRAKPSEADELHAQHAIAHFAQHKGVVRPVQEFDLVLWNSAGFPRTVPDALRPAAALWRLRLRHFWAREPVFALTSRREPLLRALYRARQRHPLPAPFALRRRALALPLATSYVGWVRHMLLHDTEELL